MEKIFVRNAKNESYYVWYACPTCGHETIENPARGFNDCPKCGQSFGETYETHDIEIHGEKIRKGNPLPGFLQYYNKLKGWKYVDYEEDRGNRS